MQDFLQPGTETLFMPAWNLQELEALRQHSFRHNTNHRVQDLTAMCGGNPLWVLAEADDPNKQSKYKAAVDAISVNALRQQAELLLEKQCGGGDRDLQEERSTPGAQELSKTYLQSRHLACKRKKDRT